jgi:hypothetical protein
MIIVFRIYLLIVKCRMFSKRDRILIKKITLQIYFKFRPYISTYKISYYGRHLFHSDYIKRCYYCKIIKLAGFVHESFQIEMNPVIKKKVPKQIHQSNLEGSGFASPPV